MGKKRKGQRNKNLKSQHDKIDRQYESENITVKKVLIVILVIAVLFGLFYLLTIGILKKQAKIKRTSNTPIQYSEILAGESFTQKKKEYLVFFYNSKEESAEENHTIISNYRDKKDSLTLYTVDMNEGLNKNYRSENEDNFEAKEASELKISKTTIIHIKNGKIVEYKTEDLKSYLGVE